MRDAQRTPGRRRQAPFSKRMTASSSKRVKKAAKSRRVTALLNALDVLIGKTLRIGHRVKPTRSRMLS